MTTPDKYLVTGGAGFIGSHLVRRLVSEGKSVRVVDNLSTGRLSRLDDVSRYIEFVEGDLADELISQKATANIVYVLHQAAVPSVRRSVDDPLGTNRANITATLNLLESSRNAGARRFVYAASSSAYGDTPTLPKTESMPPSPLSPYALQKLVGEQYCRLYYDLYGLETISLRYFNVFGPDQDPGSEYAAVIPKFASKLLADEPLTVFGDGEQSRDFTYIDNVVNANMLALEALNPAGVVCNIGCGVRITLNQLIRLLEKISGIRPKVQHVEPHPGDVRDSLADIQSADRVLGYRPSIMIDEGLRKTLNAMRRVTS